MATFKVSLEGYLSVFLIVLDVIQGAVRLPSRRQATLRQRCSGPGRMQTLPSLPSLTVNICLTLTGVPVFHLLGLFS